MLKLCTTLQNIHGHFNKQTWLSQLHVWPAWYWTDLENVHNMFNLDIFQEMWGIALSNNNDSLLDDPLSMKCSDQPPWAVYTMF